MFKRLRNFRSNKDGGTMAVFAIALPVLVGAVAVSVEAGFWVKSKSDVQMIADMASFAGAKELETLSNSQAIIAAKIDALNNGYQYDSGIIEVNSPPLTGAYAGEKAVEVIITQQGLKFFSGVINDKQIQYRVRAVSAILNDVEVCALALSETANNAMYATGSADVNVHGCSIGSNSSSNNAIRFHGSSEVTADCLHTAGSISGGGTMNLDCSSGNERASRIADPYSHVTAPTLGTSPYDPDDDCVEPVSVGGNDYTLAAGLHCDDFSIKGELELAPGIHVFNDADLKFVGGSASLVGDGVSIIMMNNSDFENLNGGAVLDVSAPTAVGHPYRGVTLFVDPDTNSSGTIKFNGGATSAVEGLIYAPNQKVEFGGNADSDTNCTLIVSDTVEFSGNANLEMDGCNANYGLGNPKIVGTFIVE